MAASRQTFAFSRDGALPMSRVFYRLNAHTGTPVNCTVACASGASLLGLLMFASPAAINAVFTIPIICQYVTFTIPIMARFFAGKEFVPGPFSLGTWVSLYGMPLLEVERLCLVGTSGRFRCDIIHVIHGRSVLLSLGVASFGRRNELWRSRVHGRCDALDGLLFLPGVRRKVLVYRTGFNNSCPKAGGFSEL